MFLNEMFKDEIVQRNGKLGQVISKGCGLLMLKLYLAISLMIFDLAT